MASILHQFIFQFSVDRTSEVEMFCGTLNDQLKYEVKHIVKILLSTKYSMFYENECEAKEHIVKASWIISRW